MIKERIQISDEELAERTSIRIFIFTFSSQLRGSQLGIATKLSVFRTALRQGGIFPDDCEWRCHSKTGVLLRARDKSLHLSPALNF